MVAQVKKVAFRAQRPDLKGSILLCFYYVSCYVFYYVFSYPEMWLPWARGGGLTDSDSSCDGDTPRHGVSWLDVLCVTSAEVVAGFAVNYFRSVTRGEG